MIVAKLECRTLTKSLLIWCTIFIVIVFGFSSVYPQMHSSSMVDVMNNSFKNLSPALLKTFNLNTSGASSFLVSTGFFAYYFQYMFLAASIYAMMLGTQALIKEETDGTIEFLYAQPLTRIEIAIGKFSANFIMLLIFWFISFLGSLISTTLFKRSGDSFNDILQGISKIYAQEGIILLFFLCLGFFVSSLLSSSKQVTGVSLGIVFGFYLIGIFSDLNNSFSWAKNISPVHMGIPANILDKSLSVGTVGILLLCCCLFLASCCWVYSRKDLKVI